MENRKDKTRGYAVKLAALTFLISFTLLLAGGISQPAQAAENEPIEVPEIIDLLPGIDTSGDINTAVIGNDFIF